MTRDPDVPDFVHDYANLASPRMGAVAVRASDEFFAAKERMLQDGAAVFLPEAFDDNGKWMDGWETRRRRGPGSDWCVIRLGVPGIVKGVNVDTSHFTGNYPPACSLEGCFSEMEPAADSADWRPLLAVTELGPSAHHFRAVTAEEPVNWLRLQIFPDGGVARLRVYGLPVRAWTAEDWAGEVELSAARNGARVLAYNDAHYGDVFAVLTEGRGRGMIDGWETRRRREPGNDWLILALAAPGVISRVEVDTAHFKGNFPDRCSLQAARVEHESRLAIVTQSMFWDELMAPQKLAADAIHPFGPELIAPLGIVSHVRLNIYPDGGISRLRLFGKLA